jgi:hypothetical protein
MLQEAEDEDLQAEQRLAQRKQNASKGNTGAAPEMAYRTFQELRLPSYA